MKLETAIVISSLCIGLLAACGGEEPDSPRIGIRDKLCIPSQQCDSAEAFFLTFYSTLSGEYKVTVHDAAGNRWSVVASGKAGAGQNIDVRIEADDVPQQEGALVRITVVTSKGGIGRLDCKIGYNWENEPCR